MVFAARPHFPSYRKNVFGLLREGQADRPKKRAAQHRPCEGCDLFARPIPKNLLGISI